MAKKENVFYLGRSFDMAKGEITENPVLYDPSDLTTHAIVTGMTGSGKTGLCVGLLEEAALQGIPAIVIDPKGDLTNLLLHFPDLKPTDFEPWLDPSDVKKSGKDLASYSEEISNLWRNGLADWNLGSKEIGELSKAVDFDIYTPGSSSGNPINILSSFQSPKLDWNENSEILREKISSIVTALLTLVGMDDIDPLKSREHILLSNLIENSWSQGKSMDLMELILQVQNPPIERLGAFPVERFFPEKDRFELAMLLNNFLASPTFQTWMEGDHLDIAKIFYDKNGKARHSIFYIAHLNESERMFFVTLLLAAVETWMRQQRGTSGLRALVYFDEIMGYLPPVKNPPSRVVLLRMLKQARAFGVGLLLATQNPADINYKALSNAGTWIVGRLQAEKDKERLLDGLTSAGGGKSRAQLDKLITKLKKRVFLIHNVHEKESDVFHTRWVLNYLAGPMTRSQIPSLRDLIGKSDKGEDKGFSKAEMDSPGESVEEKKTRSSKKAKDVDSIFSTTPPAIPSGFQEFYLPNELTVNEAASRRKITVKTQPEGFVYRAALLAQAEVRYISRKFDFQHDRKLTCLVEDSSRNRIDWEEFSSRFFEDQSLAEHPLPEASFDQVPGWLSDGKKLKSYETDFKDWVYRTGALKIKVNEKLNVYQSPDDSDTDFEAACENAMGNLVEAELDKLEDTFEKKVERVTQRISKQKLEVKEQESELSQRRMEELGKGAEVILSLFSNRKKSISSSLTKRRMTAQAKEELEQELLELQLFEKDLLELKKEKEDEEEEIKEKWRQILGEVTEVPISPYKKDIFLEYFTVVWLPYYILQDGKRTVELCAVDL
ncbi:MAG: ATP-binding protein [Anaerolineaceae bacterium]|nr:ATP-binding protein [Anaerolineaceae bacterium]